jgi:ABC-2 type transport system ATP-binding protein
MDIAPIEVHQLVYRYPRAATVALDQLEFTVARGETFGLLGPNGAGKTTLQPTAGSIRILGASPITERLRVLPHVNFASSIVDLPSNLTAAECLRVFAKLYHVPKPRQRIAALVERFELTARFHRVVGTLSAGEHMRLKLCKALLNEPTILILDEPTLSLDPYMAQKVRGLLRRLQQERPLTIVHTTHNMHEVESFCDRILFLHQGNTLAAGTPAEVLARFHSQSLDEVFIKVAQSGELVDVAPDPGHARVPAAD